MKRNDIPIVLATAAYSFLFYKQSAGFNYLLFNLIVISLLLVRDVSLIRSRAFIAAMAGCIVSSFFVFWYDTTLPYAADMISLVLLAGVSMDRDSSFIIAWLHSVYSMVGVGIFMLVDVFRNINSPDVNKSSNKVFTHIMLAVVPVIIFFVFFSIYRAGNPIFDQFAAKINFDFISIGWCFFTLGGFLLMYGFFKQRVIGYFQKIDHDTPDELAYVSEEEHIKDSNISIGNLVYTGVLLLALLNALLATVNGLDIYYLAFLEATPPGITFSQYLHNGTNSLIASIILAVCVILFYFRGYLNFYQGNKWLKALAYLWIAQNIALVISTLYRNTKYISDFGLTHKRIGVYVYLILCIAGLVTTFVKIQQQKNNWFLFRKNAWIAYSLMIVACPFDWDSIITTYDMERFQSAKTMEIDQRYLADLGHTNMAQMFQYYIVENKTLNAQVDSAQLEAVYSRSSTPEYNQEIKNMLWYQYLHLEKEYAPHHWRSHCMSKSNNLHAVEKMIADHKLVPCIASLILKPYNMTTQNKTTAALAVFSTFCVAMEYVRMKWSLTPSFIFLIWNLILAWVPYVLSVAFTEYDLKVRKFAPLCILALWVLFLPNGPYIITDILHLRQRITVPMWYDVMLVSSFAWVGLLLTMLSVRNIHSKLRAHFSGAILWAGLIVLFTSAGYGIYAGRFLRWNSWEVFYRPIYLLRRSLDELIHPFHHPLPIQVTAVVALMLSLSYMVFYFIDTKSHSHENI